MVASQNEIASRIGADVISAGGTAVDAAVATAFALAVVHPTAGNIGGGGFIVYRPAKGEPVAYDFREMAPAKASPTMFIKDGKYSSEVHHNSHLAVGVPGTVAGLHMAWKEQGKLPWKRLVDPAVALARDGFTVTEGLARSLKNVLDDMQKYPASVAQFSKNGTPYEAGETLKQPDLARTLDRIAPQGPAGFYQGETALLVEKEMLAQRRADHARRPEELRREEADAGQRHLSRLRGDLDAAGQLRRRRADRDAEHPRRLRPGRDGLRRSAEHRAPDGRGDEARLRGSGALSGRPRFQPGHADRAADVEGIRRRSAQDDRPEEGASKSSPTTFEWPQESDETTHLSVVDGDRNAVSMTYTLEQGYGVKIVVPGAGFLLNNEMGDFNAGPGLTDGRGAGRHEAEPRRAGQADAVEHDADDPREGRPARSW